MLKNRINFSFLALIGIMFPSFCMENQEKPNFDKVFKELKKKKKPDRRLSETGSDKHINPLYEIHHTTRIGAIQAMLKGDDQEVKRIVEKHPSYVESLLEFGIQNYEKSKKDKGPNKDAEKKRIAGILITSCKKNEPLENIHHKRPSINDALEITKLGNDGKLSDAKNYPEKKKKKKKKRSLSSFFNKNKESELSSSGEG